MIETKIVSNSVLSFNVTKEQAIKICEHFGKDINKMEDYEVCELLDKIIDNLTVNDLEDDLPF